MWCQQQENKGRRKAESVINWAKDAGMRLGERRWGGEGEGGAGHTGRGGRCGNIRTEESWHRGSQPKTAVKARVWICLVTMGEMGECRLGRGLGYLLSRDQKKPLDWKGSAQQDIAFGVTGQALCQQSGL